MKERLKKEDVGFTQIKNDVLEDSGISWKAKGLYCYLYSKPDDWDFSLHRIVNDSNGGKREIMTGLQELENSGYLKRTRLADGRMQYDICYTQNRNKAQKPDCYFSNMLKPQHAKTATISNKEFNTNKEETSNKEDTSKFKNFSDFIYEEVEVSYKGRDKIAKAKGITLKKRKKTDKQEKAAIALSAITYLKQKTAEIHGYYYLRQDDSRNKTVIKLAVKTLERIPDLKPLIDWYLNEDFEWCKYAPENCFAIKTIEEFENKDNKKTKTHFNC